MMTIDGSQGEGGGQILRTALALAAITGQEIRIHSIRASRSKPGLRPQHLMGALAVAEVTGGCLEGGEVDSTELRFEPSTPRPGAYRFDIASLAPSAGSVTLLAQTLLPIAIHAGGSWELELCGGTHVPFSPTYDYLADVFLPAIAGMGGRVSAELLRAGFYPPGGGAIRLSVEEGGLRPISRTGRAECGAVEARCLLCNLPDHIAKRCLDTALLELPTALASLAERSIEYPDARSPGTATAVLLSGPGGAAGFSAIGERRKRAEAVGREAGRAAAAYVSAGHTVDAHLADQLLLYMALADGESVIEVEAVTQHATTNIGVIEQFFDRRFEVDEHIIRCV